MLPDVPGKRFLVTASWITILFPFLRLLREYDCRFHLPGLKETRKGTGRESWKIETDSPMLTGGRRKRRKETLAACQQWKGDLLYEFSSQGMNVSYENSYRISN
jgi:hypothetical protein